MMLPSKKVLSILILVVALVVSIIIGFGKDKGSKAINLAQNLVVGEKISIPSNPDWQAELGKVTIDVKPISTTEENPDQTTTDAVSVSLVSNYLALKQSGTLDQASAQKLVDQATAYLEKSSGAKINVSNLKIIPDNGIQTMYAYGERLGTIMKTNKPTSNSDEITILKEAMATGNIQKINELQEAIYTYQKVADEISKMSVPQTFVKAHTDILIGMQAIILGLEEMKNVLTDPIRGLTGIQTYQEGGTLFIGAIKASLGFMRQNRIIYKQGTGGYYLFYGI